MDAVLDKALALRGVTGVLVLTRDSWLTIASRGALTANDVPEIEQLLYWTEDDSTGSIPWLGGEGGRCLHFHRAATHTLILLRHQQHQPHQVPRRTLLSAPSTLITAHSQSQSQPSSRSGSSLGLSLSSSLGLHGLHMGLSNFGFGGSPARPRMRLGWSRSSTESHLAANAGSMGDHDDDETGAGLRLGAGSASASLFAPRSTEEGLQDHGVHRPSSWC